MAIVLDVLTEYNGKGVKKAIAEFKSLEGAGAKAQFALKKAAVPATAALAGLAAAGFDAVKAAIADDAAQQKLARQLQVSAGATDAVVKSTEDWISAQGKALGITDDEIRPALAGLVRVTKDVKKSQDLMAIAFDVSAATGKPLETVTKALEKAYGGNVKALTKLDPSQGFIDKTTTADQAVGKMAGKFKGAAAGAAETMQGKFKRLKVSLDETKESIGKGLEPVIQAVLPTLQKFADWASENPETFKLIALAIGAVALSILAVNAAMALNPFSLIAAGIALLVVGLVTAYKKFGWFRDGVNAVINFLIDGFELLVNGVIMLINGIIRAYNAVSWGDDIKTLGHVKLGRLGEKAAPVGADKSRLDVMPKMAKGGIVNSPTIAMIGEAGPEAVIPLSKMNGMGGNTFVIQTGVGDPTAIGREIERIMQKYDRRSRAA